MTEIFSFRDAFPDFDEKVWFKEPGQIGEAYSSFLGWALMSKNPCFRSSNGHVVEVSKDTEWRYNRPERLNPETLDKEKDDAMGKYYASNIQITEI